VSVTSKAKEKQSLYKLDVMLRSHIGVGRGGVFPHIFNHGWKWRWAVSFTLRLFCCHWKSPRRPLEI